MYMTGLPISRVSLVLLAISVIAAIVLTILIAVLVLPEKRRPELSPFFQKLHDLIQFRHLWVETILKVLYIFTTLLICLFGFSLLFGYTFLVGVFVILIGIFVTRLMYELILVTLLILKNTRQINEKLGKSPKAPLMGLDPEAPEQKYEDAPLENEPEIAPDYRFCAHCGTRYDANKGGCPNGCK